MKIYHHILFEIFLKLYSTATNVICAIFLLNIKDNLLLLSINILLLVQNQYYVHYNVLRLFYQYLN